MANLMVAEPAHGASVRCNAKSKQSGEQCQKYAVPGRSKCHIHGGKTPQGIAVHNFKNGRYSKNLPTRLISKYDEARKDGELLALRDDLALLDSRLEDLLAKVDTGEAGETWKALQDAVHAFNTAERKGNSVSNERKQAEYKADREEAMHQILGLVQSGMSDYAAWSDIRTTLEQRRKTAETEHKRLIAMQQMITAEQALVMQSQYLEIIRRNVSDRETLIALSRDFAALSEKMA